MVRTVSQKSNAGQMGRIDILACNLAADGGKKNELVLQLEELTGFNVCASDDLTGDKAQNGDWILETDGVDAAKWYFEGEKLSLWHQTACMQGGFLPDGPCAKCVICTGALLCCPCLTCAAIVNIGTEKCLG